MKGYSNLDLGSPFQYFQCRGIAFALKLASELRHQQRSWIAVSNKVSEEHSFIAGISV